MRTLETLVQRIGIIVLVVAVIVMIMIVGRFGPVIVETFKQLEGALR